MFGTLFCFGFALFEQNAEVLIFSLPLLSMIGGIEV